MPRRISRPAAPPSAQPTPTASGRKSTSWYAPAVRPLYACPVPRGPWPPAPSQPAAPCRLGMALLAARRASGGRQEKNGEPAPTVPERINAGSGHSTIARALGCPGHFGCAGSAAAGYARRRRPRRSCPASVAGMRALVRRPWTACAPRATKVPPFATLDRFDGVQGCSKKRRLCPPLGRDLCILKGHPKGESAGERAACAASGLTGAAGLASLPISERLGAAGRKGGAARATTRRRGENGDALLDGACLAGAPARPCWCKVTAAIATALEAAPARSGGRGSAGSGADMPDGRGEGG